MTFKPYLALAVLLAAAGCESENASVDEDMATTTRTDTTTRDRGVASRPDGDGSMVGQAERDFVLEAASSGLFEVQSSQLALERNVQNDLRSFAQTMITDHTRINQELESIAERKNIDIPQRTLPKHQQRMSSMREARGEEFSQDYYDSQVQEHQQAIELFEQAAQELSDPELRSFAQRTLPVLRHHLSMIQQQSRPGAPTTAPGQQRQPMSAPSPRNGAAPNRSGTST